MSVKPRLLLLWRRVRRSLIWIKLLRLLKKLHAHLRPYYLHLAAFAAGVLVGGTLLSDGGKNDAAAADADAQSASAPLQAAAPDAQEWAELVDGMCRPDSPVNRFAMKFDFPFEQCQDDAGQIDRACVEKDAARFRPTLPEPYDANIGALKVKLEAGENWTDMHYWVDLDKAAYRGMPVQALAVRVETEPGNALRGWQTPFLVVQDDFSNIRAALKRDSHAAQTVYYADIPPEKDILSGPFDSEEQARRVSKKAGGNPAKIVRQIMKPEAAFNDKLNAVTLSCVSQPAK